MHSSSQSPSRTERVHDMEYYSPPSASFLICLVLLLQLLEGKTILQELYHNNHGWENSVPDEIQTRWLNLKSELEELQSFATPRCYKPVDFGKVAKAEIHDFLDASFKGYGQCSYLRLVSEDGQIHCSFVIGKALKQTLSLLTIHCLNNFHSILLIVSKLNRSSHCYHQTKHWALTKFLHV